MQLYVQAVFKRKCILKDVETKFLVFVNGNVISL